MLVSGTVALVLVAALVVALALRGGRTDVDPRPLDLARASPAQASTALTALVEAVRERDAAALAAAAPDDDARTLVAAVVANAEALDLRAVSARYVDQVGAVAPDGSWRGVAEISWQVAGFDRAPARAEVAVTFTPTDVGLAVTGFGADGAGQRAPLWLRGPLAVARDGDALVMAAGGASEARAYLRRAVRGAAVVRRVLPDWDGPVVLEVPASPEELDAALGVAAGTYTGIAAVTASVGDDGPDAPVHVFVNPVVTDGLRDTGAQVVVSHELVHVATDANRTPMETWLLEGFADYVALRDTRLPDTVTLGRAIAAARRDGVPRRLPTAADFATSAPDLQARYEEAWLACRVVAERLGESGLLAVYGRAARGEPLDEALRQGGLTPDRLLTEWRSRLGAAIR